jgi:hypothetical protein
VDYVTEGCDCPRKMQEGEHHGSTNHCSTNHNRTTHHGSQNNRSTPEPCYVKDEDSSRLGKTDDPSYSYGSYARDSASDHHSRPYHDGGAHAHTPYWWLRELDGSRPQKARQSAGHDGLLQVEEVEARLDFT